MRRIQPDRLTFLLHDLLVSIALKATEDSVFDILTLRGVCHVLRGVGFEAIVCRSCPVGVLPNLAESPILVKRFVELLLAHNNFDVIFLLRIRTRIVGWNFLMGFDMVTRSLEVGNPHSTYLYCMLELLTGEIQTTKDERIYCLLRRLKDLYELICLREVTIFLFRHEWGHRTVIEPVGWPLCLGDPKSVRPEEDVVTALPPEWAVDFYDHRLCIACQAAQEITYFVYSLTNHYMLPF